MRDDHRFKLMFLDELNGKEIVSMMGGGGGGGAQNGLQRHRKHYEAMCNKNCFKIHSVCHALSSTPGHNMRKNRWEGKLINANDERAEGSLSLFLSLSIYLK